MTEFKVGDWVVFDTAKPYCRLLPNNLMEIVDPEYKNQDMIVRYSDGLLYEVGGKTVRHAKSEEIKAGKRLP
ncbi:hypothetical protein [Acinetobacter pollinis]|uniref:Uncharacterized protein n=1 Tax=Acinetobacter pollinis TaxID=2605270 RepID=A0ABU6DQ25_9GAMM|nr:hypothetical protein [Acinetobacter pollinis]MEB5475961.1 hypothetical protein [Acinetobacter pollinis]